MTTANDQLVEIARAGAARFASTSLASGHSGVTRRVRRHRAARTAVTSIAGIGVIGGAAWGGVTVFGGSSDALTPVAVPSASDAPAAPASIPAVAASIDHQVEFVAGKTIDAWLEDPSFLSGLDPTVVKATLAEAAPGDADPEGWIKPGTYVVPAGSTLAQAAAILVAPRIAQFESLGIPQDQWQTVLTMASLVEREAKLNVDKPKVARVIENRLAQGMKLELDSTVKYIAPGEGVFTTDQERATDSPYNTYLYGGLPPGAISSPTDTSVDAVLHPAEGDWLFFVTVNLDTGETAFASTFEEHQANVMILQQWIKDNSTN